MAKFCPIWSPCFGLRICMLTHFQLKTYSKNGRVNDSLEKNIWSKSIILKSYYTLAKIRARLKFFMKKFLFSKNTLAYRQFCHSVSKLAFILYFQMLLCSYFSRGAQYLTGDNLKVVWAEFSTLS